MSFHADRTTNTHQNRFEENKAVLYALSMRNVNVHTYEHLIGPGWRSVVMALGLYMAVARPHLDGLRERRRLCLGRPQEEARSPGRASVTMARGNSRMRLAVTFAGVCATIFFTSPPR